MFCPTNPMIAGILSLLAELHSLKGLKINNVFCIELVFKAFSIVAEDVKPTDLLRKVSGSWWVQRRKVSGSWWVTAKEGERKVGGLHPSFIPRCTPCPLHVSVGRILLAGKLLGRVVVRPTGFFQAALG